MPNRDVTETGHVHDTEGRRVTVGTDYDAVSIEAAPGALIPLSAEDDLMKLLAQAFTRARAWAGANPQEEEV